jgi:hypothetical protein
LPDQGPFYKIKGLLIAVPTRKRVPARNHL